MDPFPHPACPDVRWTYLNTLTAMDTDYEIALGEIVLPDADAKVVLSITVTGECGLVQRTTLFFRELEFHSIGCTCVRPKYCIVVPDCSSKGKVTDSLICCSRNDLHHLPSSLLALNSPKLLGQLPEDARKMLAGIYRQRQN